MTLELWELFLAALAYLAALFLVAYSAERGSIPARIVAHPLTYTLSLGVYATSWSYYGSVGLAQSGGYNFLTIYIGVTIAFIFAPTLGQRVLQITRDYQLSSLADLFAFRYRGQATGSLVTLFMLFGVMPYIALQIRAVAESIRTITQEAPPEIIALVFCITLTVFAILFGARHITPRDKHEGLVAAIAFESAVKLIALLSVGAFAVWGVFGGLDELDAWLQVRPEALDALYRPVIEGPWVTLLFLAFCAAFLLPRQFHMTFTENLAPNALGTASWVFPIYLLLLNLPIVPILWAGQHLGVTTSADFYPLGIALQHGHGALALLTFIGGISAASAMVIVTTLALGSMCLNHLVLPASLVSSHAQTDLYRWILWGKRIVIAAIIAAGYAFYRLVVRDEGLVELGLISFVAIAQLLPGLVGLLFWPRANRVGFLAGLMGGALAWFGMLIVPLLVNAKVLSEGVEVSGLLTSEGGNIWTAATFWSLAANSLLFVAGSLLGERSAEEVEAAEICTQGDLKPLSGEVTETSPTQFQRQLSEVMGAKAGKAEVVRALDELQLDLHEERPAELRRLRERIERNLSGLLGPVLAQLIVDNRLRLRHKSQVAMAESIRFMEERLEDSRTQLRGAVRALDDLRRYHRDVLHELPIGVCSVSGGGEILIWNSAVRLLCGIDSRQALGRNLARLPSPWGKLLADFAASDDLHRVKEQLRFGERLYSFNLHKAEIAASVGELQEAGGLVILVEDRTELDTLEAELSHAARLASIGRFAAGVAHEIGNPLTGIDSIVQNMQYDVQNLPDCDERHELLQAARDVRQQGQRIGTIVKSLLAFSHGETLGAHDCEPFAVSDCIDEAVRLVGLSNTGKQVQIDVSGGAGMILTADRQRILQVLVNLLSNACDASPPGGHVEVHCGRDGEYLSLQISDRGCGIPEEQRQRIFEPFFTTKKVGEGTGLGLPLAHSIIEDHDGQLTVYNRADGGTRVIVRLPLTPPQKNARGEIA